MEEEKDRKRRWGRVVAALVVVAALAVAGIFWRELFAWFGGKASGGQPTYVATAHAGPFEVAAGIEPDPPRQAGDRLQLRITEGGQPVEGAQLRVAYVMAAMGSMPEMRGPARVRALGDGRYDASFDLPMAGSWSLEVRVRAHGQSGQAVFGLTVGTEGLTTTSGSGGAHGPAAPGEVVVPEGRQQMFGVTKEPVERRELHLDIRAVGMVTYDEARLTDVELRTGGWIQRLHVADTGQHVERGEVLFTLYSPELYSAQVDYITALSRNLPDSLEQPTHRRLSLLGMSEAQIRALRKDRTPSANVPILSPATGWVVEKNVVEGTEIEKNTRAYRIADLDEIWIEAQVYEEDLPHVHVGQEVAIEIPYLPGRTFTGQVAFVYPYVDGSTRTGTVRVQLPNADLSLRPAMYANVELQVSLGQQLAVPVSAVIYTGTRRIVFVDLGDGHLQPKDIQVGERAGDYYVVREGLAEGDVVVTSGNFLIASESRLRSATTYWRQHPREGQPSARGAPHGHP